jgi:NAD(P)-dependent dehydrogenase (short-subunit alcohol dehydrogenase family)
MRLCVAYSFGGSFRGCRGRDVAAATRSIRAAGPRADFKEGSVDISALAASGGPMFDLTGKAALVTGASGGLGLHFAMVLARQGATVTLAARRIEAVEAGRDAIRAAGGVADARRLDVTDESSIAVLFAERAFDIVVNNAGISQPRRALESDAAHWDSVLDVNLRGTFLVARAAAAAMIRSAKDGSIVNVGSILGLRVAGEVSAYAASKAGLVQLTGALALEWARYGIRVNALCPGYVETDINRDFFETPAGEAMIRRIPQRRLGKAEDLDGALLLLASDAGRYMTGSSIVVDGGHLVSSL